MIGKIFIVPAYHAVVTETAQPHHGRYFRKVRQFEEDLDLFARHFKPVSVRDVIASIRGQSQLPKRAILVTFDDGMRECYETAASLLLAKGIPAAFFLSTSTLDNYEMLYSHKKNIILHTLMADNVTARRLAAARESMWAHGYSGGNDLASAVEAVSYQGRVALDDVATVLEIDFKSYLAEKKPYMTSEQIKSLVRNGFSIGGHSVDHPHYAEITRAEQIEQTVSSVKILKERFGLDYGIFAFPFNDLSLDSDTFEIIFNSGVIDISFGISRMRRDSITNNIQRIAFETSTAPGAEILLRGYVAKFAMSMVGLGTIRR